MPTTSPAKRKEFERRKKATPGLLKRIGKEPKEIALGLKVSYWTVLRWANGQNVPYPRLFEELKKWATTGQAPQ
jgi:hypothetical protein